MEKEEVVIGITVKSTDWGANETLDVKYVDKHLFAGYDGKGDFVKFLFSDIFLDVLLIIPEPKKVWLDGDDLPDVFKVRFCGDETKYLTCRTQSASFALRRGVGGEFEYFYNSHKYELETAEWSPITENNWQKFYKYE